MGNTRFMSRFGGVMAVLLLAACGGNAQIGGGGSTVGGTTDPDPVPTTLTLLVSSPQLPSDASTVAAGVTLTAIVKDENNNVLPGVTVTFTTADSAELNVNNPAVTDSTGRVQAVLTTGGDPENREIEVTARAGTLSRSVTVDVIGTTIDVSGPDVAQFGVPVEYTVLLTNNAGVGVPNQLIAVSSNPGNVISSSSLVTGASGKVTIMLTPNVASTVLTATALGVTDSQSVTVSTDTFAFQTPATSTPPQTVAINTATSISVKWTSSGAPKVGQQVRFALTRGQFGAVPGTTTVIATTDASGVATASIQSAEAGFSTIAASTEGGPSTTATIEFVATTPANVTVQASPSTVAATQSSEITAIVRDANNNLVKNQIIDFSLSDLTTGTLSSPTAVTNSQGLARVTYTAGSLNSATQGVTITATVRGLGITDSELLTVGGRPASIVIGYGSEIIPKDQSTYQLPFTVIVTDSAGNPATDSVFRLSVHPIGYREGTFADLSAECPNEDVNLNDNLDPGEDLNTNGTLEPGRVASVPASITLSSVDGAGQFQLTYPKDRGVFVKVQITGIATVSGTETTAKRTLWLPIAEGDEDNLPGISPYGIDKNCSTPN